MAYGDGNNERTKEIMGLIQNIEKIDSETKAAESFFTSRKGLIALGAGLLVGLVLGLLV